jgi:hypothetical protein
MATMPPTPFAALEQRLGRVSNTLLSNAVGTFGTTLVGGTYDSGASTNRFGEIGMASRSPSFECCTADLPVGAVIDATVSILHLGVTTVYEIADRTDQREVGISCFDLRLP